jgi:NAD(P)-dependent dehydrogenase (short-subunit alcohol dehydrogenase family)
LASFEGRVALVTGGSSGIGAALVERLREEGAAVTVADVAEPEPTDVSDSASVRATVERTVKEHGKLDLVFSNAGVLEAARVEDMEEAMFERALAVNLRGAFLVAKHTIPHVRAAGGGAMVFTGSTSSLVGAPGEGAYGSTKAGLLNLARVLAAELARDRIRVNCVCPGWVDTSFNDPVWEFAGGRQQVEESVLATVAMRRQAQPEEVANAMLFLASDAASYMTGAALVVDGGFTFVR